MTDWSQVGTDPELLDELWGDVLDGGADASNIAALPHLAALTSNPSAVALAGLIIAAGGPSTRDEALAATLLAAANRLLLTEDGYYAHLLAGILAFEGVGYWPRLGQSLDLRYLELPCPACEDRVTLLFELSIAKASFIDEIGDTSPLLPADPSALSGLGRRLHDTAAGHGHDLVAQAVLRLFGRVSCPLCAEEFAVADGVLVTSPD